MKNQKHTCSPIASGAGARTRLARGLIRLALFIVLSAVALTTGEASAQTLTTLHSFTGSNGDGKDPLAGLIADASGNLYGTTFKGGGSRNCYDGCGTVFKLTPTGTETVLYSFTSSGDGANPDAGLIADASGNLYGTTHNGGSPNCPYRCSTVFKVTPAGTETVVYSFTGSFDGSGPRGGLIADASGNLYGTTYQGGKYGFGTVFKVTPSGSETVLYSFSDGSDGGEPYAGLIADASGNLYGTSQGTDAHGVVFKVTVTGAGNILAPFAIMPKPPTETVYRGVLSGFTLTLKSLPGFKGKVTLSCSGGPAGSRCADLPQTVYLNGTASAVSGIVFPKNSAPGSYTITLTGTSGSQTAKATATFFVK
jgi:uncharacterized repeat protein (TIGR03803 family)